MSIFLRKQLHDLIDIVDISEYETIYHLLLKFIPENDPTEDEIKVITKGKKEKVLNNCLERINRALKPN